MLETIYKQARFFVALGYPRDAVISQLKAGFPMQADQAEVAYEQAAEQFAKSERELNDQIDRDERAVASEHDLTRSIHEED